MDAVSPATAVAPASLNQRSVSGRAFHWWRVTLCDVYYAREMLLPMSIGLIVLVMALAGNFVYWSMNSIINQGLSPLPILRLFILASPGFAVQGIPAGVILGVCLILNRAVRDNEITALRVGGASIPRILAPFLGVAMLATLADWTLVEKVVPHTNDMAEKSLMKLMARSATPLLENDKYFHVGAYYFYVQSVSSDHVLHNVMVYERNSGNYSAVVPSTFPTVYIAGRAWQNPKHENQWILGKVVRHDYNDDGSQVSESIIDRVTINVGQDLSSYWADQKQAFSMTGDELSQRISDLSHAAYDQNQLLELQVDSFRRLALPCACFVMALLAAPLALRFARHGSFAGLVLAFSLAFVWQGFDSWFRALGIGGRIPPLAAAWSTNALFVLAALVLLQREK